MAAVLECADRWGRSVTLHDRCWYDHVVRRRPYFAGNEHSCVAAIVANPSFVRRDVDYADRACFYGLSPLPPPYDGLLVKVVVTYELVGPAPARGTVITVHLTSDPK
jgi:hypothetical protein